MNSFISYEKGLAFEESSPVFLSQLEGYLDAGNAGRLALVQMLHALSAKRIATFDIDDLLDYRIHRPIMSIDNWRIDDIYVPELALDLVHDDTGRSLIILHGPEPDYRWNSLAETLINLLVKKEIELSFSFQGISTAVPHTRPTIINVQSSDVNFIAKQKKYRGPRHMLSSFSSYLQQKLVHHNVTSMSLISSVPFYMSEVAYPKGASALLMRFSKITGLSIPYGDLERGAHEDQQRINRLVESNQELAKLVHHLEEVYDKNNFSGDSVASDLKEQVMDKLKYSWLEFDEEEEEDFLLYKGNNQPKNHDKPADDYSVNHTHGSNETERKNAQEELIYDGSNRESKQNFSKPSFSKPSDSSKKVNGDGDKQSFFSYPIDQDSAYEYLPSETNSNDEKDQINSGKVTKSFSSSIAESIADSVEKYLLSKDMYSNEESSIEGGGLPFYRSISHTNKDPKFLKEE